MWKHLFPNIFFQFQERSIVTVIVILPCVLLPPFHKELIEYFDEEINAVDTMLINHQEFVHADACFHSPGFRDKPFLTKYLLEIHICCDVWLELADSNMV